MLQRLLEMPQSDRDPISQHSILEMRLRQLSSHSLEQQHCMSKQPVSQGMQRLTLTRVMSRDPQVASEEGLVVVGEDHLV